MEKREYLLIEARKFVWCFVGLGIGSVIGAWLLHNFVGVPYVVLSLVPLFYILKKDAPTVNIPPKAKNIQLSYQLLREDVTHQAEPLEPA